MYAFLARHLGLDFTSISKDGEVDESFIEYCTHEQLRWVDRVHPRPKYALQGAKVIRAAFEALQTAK